MSDQKEVIDGKHLHPDLHSRLNIWDCCGSSTLRSRKGTSWIEVNIPPRWGWSFVAVRVL